MRIVTWNMQGGANTLYINQVVAQTQANVLCLQECGNLAVHLQGRAPILAANGAIIGYTGNLAVGFGFMECVFWENPWIQGSLAVLSNVGIVNYGILDAVAVMGVVLNNVRNLPWITVNNPATGIPITVFSIHGPPVFGVITVANVCAWDNAQIGQIALMVGGANWACVGDFNADPTDPAYIAPPAGNVVRGNHATQQGGGLLDYAVTNAGAFAYLAQTQLTGASDHYPQVFNW